MKPIEKTIETVFERRNKCEENKRRRQAKTIKIVSILSCVCILLGIAVAGSTGNADVAAAEDYRILLDINPSIEISVDENNNVMDVAAMNEDGAGVLDGVEIQGKSAEDALKTVISEIVDLGYISEEANSVLVSIEGADESKDDELKMEIANSISQAMSAKSLDGAIVVQAVSADDAALSSLSMDYGISVGKAQLINQIIEQNKLHTFDELSVMSIHELNLLRVSYFIDMENVYQTGTPAELAYIGAQNATDAALADAQVAGEEIEARLECRESAMLYCVEFESGTNRFRYRINAVTGEIISAEKIDIGSDSFAQGEQTLSVIGENAAIRAALIHAGMEDSMLIRCKFNRDWVDGISIYNLNFTDGITSGKYVINACTGEIIQFSETQEYHDRSIKADVIGYVEAKRIALAKDGLIDGNVSKCEIFLKAEDQSYVYDLSYICNAAKYTVQINAVDGTVISYEKLDIRDTGTASAQDGTSVSVENK